MTSYPPPTNATTAGSTSPIGSTTADAVDNLTERLPDSISDKAQPVADAVKDNAADLGEKADQVKQHVGEAMSAGKEGAGEVLETATQKAQEVGDEVLRQARDLIGEARTQLSQQAGDQHKKAAQSLRSLSDQLGSMARSGDQEGLAVELVSQARDHVQNAADWLERREPGDLLDDVRDFARRKPGTFLLGAAAAGILAGRMTRGVAAAHSSTASSTSSQPPTMAQPPAVPAMPSPASDPSTYPTQVLGYSSPPDSGVGYQPTTEREPGPRSYSGTTGVAPA